MRLQGADVFTTTENIHQDYEVIKIVHGYALESAKGCSSTVANIRAFEQAEAAMVETAVGLGADAVIGVSFQQRDTRATGCTTTGRAAVEV